MRKSIVFVICLLVLTGLACGFNFSSANIQEAITAKDADGNEPATIFDQDDTFYTVVEVANAPDDTTVRAVWSIVEADGEEPNQELWEDEVSGSNSNINFSLSNDQLWPVGQYKVELYLNDELDRTLEFEVEGDIVAEAEPTEEPTDSPTPTAEPASASEPTEERSDESAEASQSSSGDSLSLDAVEEPEEEYEPLPFKEEPYVHPSGAFTFALPESFEGVSGDASSVIFGDDRSRVGVVFTDAGEVYSEKEMDQFIDLFVEGFMSEIGDEYEILVEEVQPDDSIYLGTVYEASNESGDADFFFEQRETIVFVLFFVTTAYEEMNPTWNEIIASYRVDPEAALEATAPEPTRPAVQATQPPAANNSLAPPAGRSRVFLRNEYGQEVFYDVAGQGKSVAPGNVEFVDLDAGMHTYTVSIPGGAANGEFEIGPNQSWMIFVTKDGGVGQGQVYP